MSFPNWIKEVNQLIQMGNAPGSAQPLLQRLFITVVPENFLSSALKIDSNEY